METVRGEEIRGEKPGGEGQEMPRTRRDTGEREPRQLEGTQQARQPLAFSKPGYLGMTATWKAPLYASQEIKLQAQVFRQVPRLFDAMARDSTPGSLQIPQHPVLLQGRSQTPRGLGLTRDPDPMHSY